MRPKKIGGNREVWDGISEKWFFKANAPFSDARQAAAYALKDVGREAASQNVSI